MFTFSGNQEKDGFIEQHLGPQDTNSLLIKTLLVKDRPKFDNRSNIFQTFINT